MSANDRLPSLLRSALKHLYDPTILADSPLVPLLALAGSLDPASDLRQTLTRAIRALQPEADVPADAQVWRLYEILLYRYVERSSQLEVADQLGVSIRHLGRLESQAIQVLADRLRQQMGESALEEAAPSVGDTARGGAQEALASGQTSPISDELPWLAEAGPRTTADLGPVLSSVMELVQPMARQHGVTLDLSLCPDLTPLAVHPVALRQILLSLLGAAIRQMPGGKADLQRALVTVRVLQWDVEVQVQAPRKGPAVQSDGGIADSLEMARRLADACGGSMAVRADAGGFVATVTLPAIEQTPVLVIDDNANTLRLLQRYASNTRYRVIPAASLQEGMAMAQESPPRIIVLDVMMPEIDGWEVLGRLRQHPLTSHIPIIICTILAEEELALSLGASGFLRKPVSREAFLGALDLAGPEGPESH